MPKARALEGGALGYPPQIIFKFEGSKTLFSALIMRYISEESTSNKCEKAGVFIAYKNRSRLNDHDDSTISVARI